MKYWNPSTIGKIIGYEVSGDEAVACSDDRARGYSALVQIEPEERQGGLSSARTSPEPHDRISNRRAASCGGDFATESSGDNAGGCPTIRTAFVPQMGANLLSHFSSIEAVVLASSSQAKNGLRGKAQKRPYILKTPRSCSAHPKDPSIKVADASETKIAVLACGY